jgi:serine/threonine protein kinase
MIQIPISAAESLENKILKGKWTVTKKVSQGAGATGGFFSVSYLVTDGNQEAFLKALDFQAFFRLNPGQSIVNVINEMTSAFQYEKELLLRCKNSRLSKVSMILDEGEEFIPGFLISQVPYLIFEKANGDVRNYFFNFSGIEIAWKLRSLHNVAVGMRQLHGVKIAHQDLKPSNILLFDEQEVSKLADLGRSLCQGIVSPHENGGHFSGDLNYAPPEFLYRYIDPDYNKRVMATDVYLFGSLIVFYFLGTNMTSLIGKNMDPQFKWDRWGGNYEDVKDYLVEGFFRSIEEFRSHFSNKTIGDEIAKILIYCCHPVIEKRGHPTSVRTRSNQYSFERIISNLDMLAKKAKYRLI